VGERANRNLFEEWGKVREIVLSSVLSLNSGGISFKAEEYPKSLKNRPKRKRKGKDKRFQAIHFLIFEKMTNAASCNSYRLNFN
jgi:hypothetical protein